MSPIYEYRHACGPLGVQVTTNNERMRQKVADTLDLYNVQWPDALSPLHLDIRCGAESSTLGDGNYLVCARMHVDTMHGSGHLRATCRAGAIATGNATSGSWEISMPAPEHDPWILTDTESLLSLVLTEGWRAAGWVPLHAGAVSRNGTCAILCAESGGGKTSLTAALIRRGWRTLGDDKLLLRVGDDGNPELRALVHTFNLHPRTRSWFPEVGDLEDLPVYSEWTDKRKVNPESIWPGTTLASARPTHLLQLTRNESGKPLMLESLSDTTTLSALLRQTVVPSHAGTARQILSAVVATSRQLDGYAVDIGEDVYNEPAHLEILDWGLR